MISRGSTAMNDAFEFRVLTGCHTGVCAPAHAGMLVGADLDSDIILADDGLPDVPWRIGIADDRWGVDDTASLALNTPHQLGPVWVTIARADQPWPSPPSDADASPDNPDEDSGAAVAVGTDGQGDADMRPDATDGSENGVDAPVVVSPDDRPLTLADSDTGAATDTRPGRPLVYVGALVACVVGLAILMGIWRPGVSTAHIETAGAGSAAHANTEAIRQILHELGYGDSVSIVVPADGPVRLQGWVNSVADQEAIASAMTRVWPMPALRLHVSAQVLDDVSRLVSGQPVYYDVSIRNGHIHLEGVAEASDDIPDLAQRVDNLYPDVPVVVERVVGAHELLERFSAELERAGLLDSVELGWSRAHLDVDVSNLDLPAQQAAHEVATNFNREHWGRVQLTGMLEQGPTLPFAIRSVVSGPHPYVVLPDGEKILQGGSHQGYRLVSIDSGRVRFEGNNDVVLPR